MEVLASACASGLRRRLCVHRLGLILLGETLRRRTLLVHLLLRELRRIALRWLHGRALLRRLRAVSTSGGQRCQTSCQCGIFAKGKCP